MLKVVKKLETHKGFRGFFKPELRKMTEEGYAYDAQESMERIGETLGLLKAYREGTAEASLGELVSGFSLLELEEGIGGERFSEVLGDVEKSFEEQS